MYAACEAEVCFDRITAPEIALNTSVELIALRNSYLRIETSRKVRVLYTELLDQRRLDTQRLGKTKIRSDERTPLSSSHQLSRRRIAKLIRVEEQLLLPESEIINRAQQRAIEENATAKPQHKLA
jgi:hypothetical protein